MGGAGLRAINVGVPAFCCDEFFDVFAARSWLEGQGFQVPGREYTRALLMTRATGLSFVVFGESEWAARLPALVAGILTLGVVYLMGRLFFGHVAAVVALALTAVSVHAIDTSRFARLYSLLTLLLLVCVAAAYRGVEGRPGEGPRRDPARLAWLGLAGVCGVLASSLHPVAVAVGIGFQAYVTIMAVASAARGDSSAARAYGGMALLILVLEAVAFSVPELRTRLVRAAFEPLPWYNPVPGDSWVHHEHLASIYGWIWYAVLPATLVVTAGRVRPGLFLGLVFWVPFLAVALLVATKHPRYVIQFLPLAWLIIGGGAEIALSGVGRVADPATTLSRVRRRPPLVAAAAVVVLASVYLLLRVTPALPLAVQRPWKTTGTLTTGSIYDWRGVARELGPAIPGDAVIVSDLWHESIYYLRRHAYQLLAAHREFGEGDWETPDRDYSEKIQNAGHLARLIAQRPVWIIASKGKWRSGRDYREDLTRFAEERCTAVSTPAAETFAVVFDCATSSMPVMDVDLARRAASVPALDGVHRPSPR